MSQHNQFGGTDFSPEFRTWAKIKGLTPAKLHHATGWTYNYCCSLLNGTYPFRYQSFGMILVAFGAEELNRLWKLVQENKKGVYHATEN